MNYRFCTAAALFFLMVSCSAVAAQQTQPLTQRDWMRALVDALGWSFGLPDEPQESDYQSILSGERTFRIEAEDAHQSEDLVAVKSFDNFGPFSGDGWVAGIATKTRAHLKFLLPHDGIYQVTAALRLAGHRIYLAEQAVEAAAGNRFERVNLGEFFFEAGMQEVVVELPPSGAIDYLEFEAPPLPKVEPLGGWKPQQTLNRSDLAVTAVRLMDAEGLLPPAPHKIKLEVEDARDRGGAHYETSSYLGSPSAGGWLRAGTTQARLRLPFRIERAGAYRISIRGAGSLPATLTFNDGYPRNVALEPFLAEKDAGTLYFERGAHHVDIVLAPGAGVDVLVMHALRSDPTDYARLAGMSLSSGIPGEGEIDRLLSLLAVLGTPR